jgi:hypothetical protein
MNPQDLLGLIKYAILSKTRRGNLGKMNTIDLLQSKEYDIFKRLTNVGEAYTRLTNPHFDNIEGAKTALKEMRAASNDLEQIVRAALLDYGVPSHLIRNLTPWTNDTLDSKYCNSVHHYYRYLHAQTDDQKIKEITGFHSIVLDMIGILEVTTAEQYYKGGLIL